MTYPVNDDRETQYTVQASDWNQLAGNSNDANNRLSVLETNQGSRGGHGTVYSELNNLKTDTGSLGSRLTAVEGVNDQQDAWNTAHLGGVSTNDATHDRINSRLAALEAASGGNGSGTPAFFKAWISADQVNINGGWNMPFSSTGISYVQQGGFTVSGEQVFLPSDGIYLVAGQAVFNSISSGSGTFGLYATRNGSSGAADSLCAQEVQYSNNSAFAAVQISATEAMSGNDFISYRLYAASSRGIRGLAYVDSQDRNLPYGGTFITITRLGGIEAA